MGWRIAVIVFLGGIGGGLVFPILPIVGVKLGISAVLIGLILSANRITRLGANLVTGQLVDRFGGKGPLTIGLLIEGVATFLYSVALTRPDPGLWFLIGRASWGVGSSFLIVGGMAMALKASGHGDRGRVTSLVRSAQGIGMPAGLVVGGIVAGFWSDNAAFLLASALTLVAAAVTVAIVPGLGYERERRRVARAQAPAGAPAGLGGQKSWAIFRRLVVSRAILMVWIMNFLVFFSLRGLLMSTLVIAIDKRHIYLFGLAAEPTASVLMAVMLGLSAGVTVLVGRLLDRSRTRILLVLPSLVFLLGGFVLLSAARSLPVMMGSLGMLGIAMGGTSVPLLTLMGDLVPPATYGRAVGFYQVFGDGGGSVGPIFGVWAGLHFGFAATYLIVAAVMAVFFPFVVWLWRVERSGGAKAVV